MRHHRGAGALDLGPEVAHREPALDRRAPARRAACRRRTIEIALKWNSGSGVSTMSSGAALPRARDLVGEAHDVVVREHAALGRTGRARGVDEAREVAGRTCDASIGVVARRARARRPSGSRARASITASGGSTMMQCVELGRRLGADDLDRARREVALHDEHLRAGVGELVAQELALVRGVDRHLDRAELQRGEEADDLLGAVVEQRRDAVAVADAERRRARARAGSTPRPSRARCTARCRLALRSRGTDRRDRTRGAARALRARWSAAASPYGPDSSVRSRRRARRRRRRRARRPSRSACRAPTRASGRGARRPPT